MTFRLYLDEDSVNRALIRALTARGMDVSNAVDAGRTGITDAEQLAYSTGEGRVLYSSNVGDFCRLHKSWMESGRSHGGLLLVAQQRLSIGEQLRAILRLNRELASAELRDRVEFVTRWS